MTNAPKRSRGRPSEGERVEVRIPANLLAHLDREAKKVGVSRAEQIRRILSFRYG